MVKIEKIPIGQELRPLHFGFAALADWCEISGNTLNDLSSLGDKMGLKDTQQLLYCGLKHGARREKEEFKHTLEDVGDWIDEEGFDVLNKALEVFSKSMTQLTPNEKKQKGTQKK
tara:strand:- start:2785 stop:3129 length:345 start_codon:yes stop_codon:yes gene_type:complete